MPRVIFSSACMAQNKNSSSESPGAVTSLVFAENIISWSLICLHPFLTCKDALWILVEDSFSDIFSRKKMFLCPHSYLLTKEYMCGKCDLDEAFRENQLKP